MTVVMKAWVGGQNATLSRSSVAGKHLSAAKHRFDSISCSAWWIDLVRITSLVQEAALLLHVQEAWKKKTLCFLNIGGWETTFVLFLIE